MEYRLKSIMFTVSFICLLFQIDEVAINILNMTDPEILATHTPAGVEGDGNCLYRAASLFLFGSQNNHTYLRFITTLEIILNPQFYNVRSTSFPASLKNSAIFTPCYRDILTAAVTDRTDSDMIHLYALSAAVKLPINSFCPTGASLFPVGVTHPYTKIIVGRDVQHQSDDAAHIHLMWTAKHVPSENEVLCPTHLVCLIPSSMTLDDSEPGSIDNTSGFSDTSVSNKGLVCDY